MLWTPNTGHVWGDVHLACALHKCAGVCVCVHGTQPTRPASWAGHLPGMEPTCVKAFLCDHEPNRHSTARKTLEENRAQQEHSTPGCPRAAVTYPPATRAVAAARGPSGEAGQGSARRRPGLGGSSSSARRGQTLSPRRGGRATGEAAAQSGALANGLARSPRPPRRSWAPQAGTRPQGRSSVPVPLARSVCLPVPLSLSVCLSLCPLSTCLSLSVCLPDSVPRPRLWSNRGVPD